MSGKYSPLTVIKNHRTVFIALGVFFILLELAIFAIAAVRSGEQYKLQFVDKNGNMVYETDGRNLTDFNVYHFEKTHGPVEEYRRRLVKRDVPFPFRAWFVAALGIPLGLILGFVLILRMYTAIFYGEDPVKEKSESAEKEYQTRAERLVGGIGKFNIFVIGAAIFLAVISYWILPNLVMYLGEVSIETLIRFKWVFLFIGLAIFAVVVLIIYLKYLLAKKSMESQVEVDKYRMQLEYKGNGQVVRQLEDRTGKGDEGDVVDWEEETGPEEGESDSARG
jgi:hypothetical protein